MLSVMPPYLPRRTIVLLGALTALAPMSCDVYLPGLPALRRSLGASAAAAQLTLSACLLGLAVGQLLAGPLSDSHGRRRPLLAGLLACTAASFACAAAPDIPVLIALRFVQGAAGASAIVIATAIVRDIATGERAARAFASLMVVFGVAPVAAPVLGAQILRFASWRAVFVALGALGAVLLAITLAAQRETLPAGRRRADGLGGTLHAIRRLLRDRTVVGCCLAFGLGAGAMFAYLAGSPFVLQDLYGLSPQAYALVFAANALGLVAASQAGRRVVGATGPRALLAAGVAACALGGACTLAALAAHAAVGVVLAALFVVVASMGLVFPNATAHALAEHGDDAGAAAGLLGLAQYVFGAVVAPVVGIAGAGDALPMGIAMAALGAAAVVAFAVLVRAPEAERAPLGRSAHPPGVDRRRRPWTA
jgi:MFS transporter, DHA1 family, multidrug resistance protein